MTSDTSSFQWLRHLWLGTLNKNLGIWVTKPYSKDKIAGRDLQVDWVPLNFVKHYKKHHKGKCPRSLQLHCKEELCPLPNLFTPFNPVKKGNLCRFLDGTGLRKWCNWRQAHLVFMMKKGAVSLIKSAGKMSARRIAWQKNTNCRSKKSSARVPRAYENVMATTWCKCKDVLNVQGMKSAKRQHFVPTHSSLQIIPQIMAW